MMLQVFIKNNFYYFFIFNFNILKLLKILKIYHFHVFSSETYF
jgi:hypothetical protein